MVKVILARSVAAVSLCVAIAGSQGEVGSFKAFYIPISVTNCMASYDEAMIENWHNISSIFSTKRSQQAIVGQLTGGDGMCHFQDYNIRLKIIDGKSKLMMDQEGCVNINGKIAQLSDAQLSKVIYQIRESLPYNDLHTYGASEQSQVNNGGFSTSVRTTQSVYIAVNDFKKLKKLSDAELEFCRIAVEDAGEKVVVNISLPSESIRQELYGMPAKPVVSYTLLKSNGQILECRESH